MIPAELWEPSCKPRQKISKGAIKGELYIILIFNSKYKRQWINVIFLQDKHNINAMS
jgi:hypothetical protein